MVTGEKNSTLGRRAEQDTPTSNDGLIQPDDTLGSKKGTDAKGKGGSKNAKNCVSCQVALLDGNDFTVEIPKGALGKELVEKVCDHLDLLEKDYFSCSYTINDIRFWLNHEKKIAKQVKSGSWSFKFEVKFYPTDPVTAMSEDLTRYQLFLQLRVDIYTGRLPCSFVTLALLGSFAAQSEFGEYSQETCGLGINYLKESAPYAPNQTDDLLEKIMELHKTYRDQSPAEAEINYLDNAKFLALYGVDLHPAKDSDNIDVMVGVCSSGLVIYRDRLRIHRFAWAKILKIAYKRNIFSIKVRPGEYNMSNDSVVAFKLLNYTMAKRLWKTAVEHHAFFRLKEPEPPVRPMFPLFGSKFRYSGRTQYQTKKDSSNIARPAPNIVRAPSGRNPKPHIYNASGPSNVTERKEETISGEPHTATLDLKKIRNKGIPRADMDDDKNFSGMDSYKDGQISTSNYSSVRYDKNGMFENMGNGSKFDQYGRPIGAGQSGVNGPFNGIGGDDDDLPPYQEDHHLLSNISGAAGGKYGRDKNNYSVTSTKTTTRSYLGPDGKMVTEHQVIKDGVIETKTLITDTDDFDHDKALTDAILGVTEMNPNYSVEKIEIKTNKD